jgi:hypothetical protein
MTTKIIKDLTDHVPSIIVKNCIDDNNFDINFINLNIDIIVQNIFSKCNITRGQIQDIRFHIKSNLWNDFPSLHKLVFPDTDTI